MVRDAGERGLLYELDQCVQQATMAMGGESRTVQQLAAVYHNLLRRWADT